MNTVQKNNYFFNYLKKKCSTFLKTCYTSTSKRQIFIGDCLNRYESLPIKQFAYSCHAQHDTKTRSVARCACHGLRV